MKIYREKGSFSIPCKLIDLYKKMDLEDNELISILKILSVTNNETSIVTLMKDTHITKEELTSLSLRGVITMEPIDSMIMVKLEPMYLKLEKGVDSEYELSLEKLEKVKHLLDRSLSNVELKKLKEWMNEGFTFKEIELAIQKSLINEVDNFKYIETVLVNNQKRSTNEGKITRRDDLY